jgi:hypothetical protein
MTKSAEMMNPTTVPPNSEWNEMTVRRAAAKVGLSVPSGTEHLINRNGGSFRAHYVAALGWRCFQMRIRVMPRLPNRFEHSDAVQPHRSLRHRSPRRLSHRVRSRRVCTVFEVQHWKRMVFENGSSGN